MTGHWRMNIPREKFYAALWMPGPIRNEARRIAKELLRKRLAKKGYNLDLQTERTIENGVTVLLYNAQEHFLKLAKFNLENRG